LAEPFSILAAFLMRHGRRRRLHHEREALVREGGDHHGNRQTRLEPGSGVERLAELHDVQAALTERGTDRGRGVGLARRHLQLDVKPTIFFAMMAPVNEW
jgi:hypothetical protein